MKQRVKCVFQGTKALGLGLNQSSRLRFNAFDKKRFM